MNINTCFVENKNLRLEHLDKKKKKGFDLLIIQIITVKRII